MFIANVSFANNQSFSAAVKDIDQETLSKSLSPFLDLICPLKIEDGAAVEVVEVPDTLAVPGLKHYFKYVGHEPLSGTIEDLDDLRAELSVRERFYPIADEKWAGDQVTGTVHIFELAEPNV